MQVRNYIFHLRDAIPVYNIIFFLFIFLYIPSVYIKCMCVCVCVCVFYLKEYSKYYTDIIILILVKIIIIFHKYC